uniref:NADH-ubiquinone oxidoreductase chain 1 n=1 Tax=Leptorhynchoides thecatus TaxID=60532 RepID=Q5DNB6_LEPTH|nr:NADH dehydrogenase subunit 1 [Leptorhynchoides thecatus]AAT64941.1 NADH dehydrogenase subunit 1 [Leptorhynchoides thecatus]
MEKTVLRLVLNSLIIVIIVLVLLSFFTLLERKVLGLGQVRKGPNKGIIWGLFQPLLDGFKLFMKGINLLSLGGLLNYYFSPMLGLSTVLFIWGLFSLVWGSGSMTHIFVIPILISSLLIYFFYLSGLFSGSVYGVLGSLRAAAQFLSYECIVLLSFISMFGLLGSYLVPILFVPFLISIIFILLVFGVIMEVNRTPVDFVEGESELVSGLVTEMGGLSFSCLVLGEYGMMCFYSVFISEVMLQFCFDSMMFVLVFSLFFMWCFNWLRLSLPRSRCDLMMMLGWKVCLILIFLNMVMVYSMSMLLS